MTDEKQYIIIGNIYGDAVWFCKTIAWSKDNQNHLIYLGNYFHKLGTNT